LIAARRRRMAKKYSGLRQVGGKPAGVPGENDTIEKHPDRDQIDFAIVHRTLSAQKILERWPELGKSVSLIYNRKNRLRRRLAGGERQGRSDDRARAAAKVRRTIDLVEWPLQAAQEGFEMAKEVKDLGAGSGFIKDYLASMRMHGELTGELAPAGQTLINQDNRQMHIMSLPRGDDPEEVVEASNRLVEAPARKQVVDLGVR